MADESPLRRHAETIWRAGVRAVDSGRLIREAVRRRGSVLTIDGETIDLGSIGRVAVVGGGKAGAGMAAALEDVLGPDLVAEKVTGWVNVPADCLRPTHAIHLHSARPAGVNEPIAAGVAGSEQILRIVSDLGEDDLCVVLLSGGGSALLPAPTDNITLDDKLRVTRLLMGSGATIHELNCVRKHLSRIKGGGLARACRAGRRVSLIISDVIGDRLDVIASGPTVVDSSTAADALAVLRKYAGTPDDIPAVVRQLLERPQGVSSTIESNGDRARRLDMHNVIIGNNATALHAAAETAAELGYSVQSLGSENNGEARDVGRELAQRCLAIRQASSAADAPVCLLSGGEPVVHLVPTDRPRKGGRNQELVLAGLIRLRDAGLKRIVLLSGGTDGEDGPTDAAGAIADQSVLDRAKSLRLNPGEFLAINNSYPFFDQTGGLLRTGPTHTNVMDLRVAIVAE